jgi:hypothetical protein
MPRSTERTSLPKYSRTEVQRQRFIWQKQTYTVGSCEDEVFKQFIEHCGYSRPFHHSKNGSGWTHARLDTILSDLDECCDDIARWYAIESLMHNRVHVPFIEAKPPATKQHKFSKHSNKTCVECIVGMKSKNTYYYRFRCGKRACPESRYFPYTEEGFEEAKRYAHEHFARYST